jgi:probable HAF family extracellular repeat protein
MIDLGTLGGTCGSADALNNRGKVVGLSNLAGNLTYHPFLWSRGVLTDLGTLGGNNGHATWLNDAGDVVGGADLPGSQVHDAFLWKHGVMTDLGNLGQTSFAHAINSEGQVVGHSKINDGTFRAFLWEGGGPMIDLNTLIPPGSSLTLTDAIYVNDRGEIAGNGLLPNGDGHAYLLIPNGDCDDDCEGRIAASQNRAVQYPAATQQKVESPREVINQLHKSLTQPSRFPGQRSAPRD